MTMAISCCAGASVPHRFSGTARQLVLIIHPDGSHCIGSGSPALWPGNVPVPERPSEAAGRAMAFKVSEPVIRFLLVVPISLFSGMIFRSILNDDIWTVFGLICGLLITSCLIEIIYHFDF